MDNSGRMHWAAATDWLAVGMNDAGRRYDVTGTLTKSHTFHWLRSARCVCWRGANRSVVVGDEQLMCRRRTPTVPGSPPRVARTSSAIIQSPTSLPPSAHYFTSVVVAPFNLSQCSHCRQTIILDMGMRLRHVSGALFCFVRSCSSAVSV